MTFQNHRSHGFARCAELSEARILSGSRNPLIADFSFMQGYVYILFSPSLQKTYVGSTDNVQRRLIEHNLGKSKFTSWGIPWLIWHVLEFPTLTEARKMEKYFKTGAGRKALRKILDDIPKP